LSREGVCFGVQLDPLFRSSAARLFQYHHHHLRRLIVYQLPHDFSNAYVSESKYNGAIELTNCRSPGDRHHLSGGIANPFGESPPRISTYTAQEIATLQSRLDKQLGPEYLSSRQGPGGAKVHYLAAEKVINLANEVFGFNGWSSAIRDTTIDYVSVIGLRRQS
jgi:hypothetical protein